MSHTVVLVDTISSLDQCLTDISSPLVTKLAVDLEGIDLCRLGKISILQIFPNSSNTIWLVDITTLGQTAFDHKDGDGRCIRDILQSNSVEKIFYDVRNDADALYNLYAVDVGNAYDLQLLEVAVRRAARHTVKFLSGLGKAVETYLTPPADWKYVKEKGVALFQPEHGGSYEVFEKRPLDPIIMTYCAQDVALLFRLEAALEGRLGMAKMTWKDKVANFSASRVAESHSSYYAGKGRHRAVAPLF